jgi:hypothetical protein
MRRNDPRLTELDLKLLVYTTGKKLGKELIMNEQTDNVSNNSTIMEKAGTEWRKWATENNISPTNTTPETYMLMQDAFVDGYTNGFVKRFTEGE